MFGTVVEKVIVGVLTTIALAAVYALWDAVRELRVGFGVPQNAVLVFDEPSGCPDGWVNMGEDWRGLVAVAAVRDTNDKYGFGRRGGSETHVLTEAEIPSHFHGAGDLKVNANPHNLHASASSEATDAAQRTDGIFKAPPHTRDYGSHDHVLEGTTSTWGGGSAHNNMSPYIALYYCKKE